MTERQVTADELLADYKSGRVWDHARYWYETWRKTTALTVPMGPWEEIDPRWQVAICSIVNGVAQEASEN